MAAEQIVLTGTIAYRPMPSLRGSPLNRTRRACPFQTGVAFPSLFQNQKVAATIDNRIITKVVARGDKHEEATGNQLRAAELFGTPNLVTCKATCRQEEARVITTSRCHKSGSN
jgi:hypothetical protein